MLLGVASHYKAPELYEPAALHTFESDIWAMGITMLEVLTGKRAWTDMVDHDQRIKIPKLLKEGKRPDTLDRISIKEGKALVNKCLNWTAAQRLSSEKVASKLSSMIGDK